MDAFSNALNDMLMSTYHSISVLEEAMLEDMSQGNLSISEMHMIEAIAKDKEEGRSITDLAQEQEITLPSVTMCIKKLEKKGFVTKTRSTKDGRRVIVKLTRSGLRVEVAHRYFHRQMANTIKSSLDIQEQSVLLKTLVMMNDFLKEKAAETQRHLYQPEKEVEVL